MGLLDLPPEIFEEIVRIWIESVAQSPNQLKNTQLRGVCRRFDEEIHRAVCNLKPINVFYSLKEPLKTLWVSRLFLERTRRNELSVDVQNVRGVAKVFKKLLEEVEHTVIVDEYKIWQEICNLFLENFGNYFAIRVQQGLFNYKSFILSEIPDYNDALSLAAYVGNIKVIGLASKKVHLDDQGPLLGRALHAAALGNKPEVVVYLLDHGADVSVRDRSGNFPLHIAAMKGRVEIVKLLMDGGADHSPLNSSDRTPLREAAVVSQLATTQLLIDYGADINAQGNAVLCDACERNNTDMVQLFLQNGAVIHPESSYGQPLNTAVIWNAFKCIELLLKYGANINAIPRTPAAGNNITALGEAVHGNRLEMSRFLLSKGADPNVSWSSHRNPICEAASSGNIDIVYLLLDHGADLKSWDEGHGNLLLSAVHGGNLEVVRLFLDLGLGVNEVCVVGGRDRTPLLMASLFGRQSIVSLLLEHGANVNTVGMQMMTPLLMAVTQGHYNTTKILLDAGADLDFVGPEGTAYDISIEDEDEKMREILEKARNHRVEQNNKVDDHNNSRTATKATNVGEPK